MGKRGLAGPALPQHRERETGRKAGVGKRTLRDLVGFTSVACRAGRLDAVSGADAEVSNGLVAICKSTMSFPSPSPATTSAKPMDERQYLLSAVARQT